MESVAPIRRLHRALAFGAFALLALLASAIPAWRIAFARVRDDGRLAAWANPRPERLKVSWREIRSPLPGRLEIEGLRVAGRTRRLRWEVTAEGISGWLSPSPLAHRELAFTTIRARGVRVQVESSLPPAEPGAVTPPPRIPDFPAGPPPPVALRARPWSFAFRDIEVASLSEVRIDDQVFTGSARGRGGFTIVRRETAEILPSELTLSGVAVSSPGARHARDVDGRVSFRVDPYPYRGIRPIDLLDRLTGEIDLDGELDPEAALAYLSRGWPSLELESGVSRVAARLRLDHGLLEAGSRLDIPAARQTLRFLGFEARGSARLEARVESALGAPRLRSELTLADWQLGRPGAPGVAFGDGLRLTARAELPSLLAPPPGGELDVDLGRARIPDLGFLNSFVPAAAGLQIEQGEVSLGGRLHFSRADGEGDGLIEARGERVRLLARGQHLAGDLEADIRLSEPDLRAGTFSLAGTHVALRRVSAETSGGDQVHDWWGDATLTAGRIDLRPPLSFAGDFTAKLADTRPLVAFYEIRHDLSAWTERLLTVEGLSATGSFEWSVGRFALRRGFVPLTRGELRARFLLQGGESQGRLLARWRRLMIGVELAGGKRTVHIRDAEEWFEADPESGPGSGN